MPVSSHKGCEVWTQAGLVNHFYDHDRKMQDRRFSFILGAGASASSGIPDARKLGERWVSELHRRHASDGTAVEDWATAESLEIEGFSWSDIAESYCHIYKRRFLGDPEEGFADLEIEMLGKKPGSGYAILAHMLATTRHNLVITTNFDNLIQDAMFMYTNKVPQVCGHESLAAFFQVKSRRAAIAKIHRDLLMAPMSQSEEIGELQDAWREPLAQAFSVFTPIVIGYGGNDGSLMGFLSEMEPGRVRGRLFWCYYEPSGPPKDSICNVVSRLKGVLVPLEKGFDGLMAEIQERMKFPAIEAILDARLTEFREHAAKLTPRMGTSTAGLASPDVDAPLISAPDASEPTHPESIICLPCHDGETCTAFNRSHGACGTAEGEDSL